jgi:hypothetical protein
VELGAKKDQLSTKGLCACIVNFTVNRNYSSKDNNSRYCIENQNQSISSTQAPQKSTETVTTTKLIITTIQPKTVPPVTLKTSSTSIAPSVKPEPTKKVEITTPKSSIESQTKATSDNNDKKHDKQEEIKAIPPQTHHILGGIIIPIMIVFAFIGVVYGIRKYDVLERAQNYIRNRRTGGQTHQTRYDGLENDFDDDPLLI